MREMNPSRHVVIVQFSPHRDGSAMSALLLANGLSQDGWRTTVLFASDGPMMAEFEAHGHRVTQVPHKNWLRSSSLHRTLRNWRREWVASTALQAVLAREKPDIVYVNTGASVAGVVAAQRLGLPVLWHLRELFGDVGGELVVPKSLRRIVQQTFLRGADRLVVNSNAVAKNLLGGKGGKATVVYNAVNDRFFEESRSPVQAKSALRLPEDRQIVGVPGTLRPMKGHPFFFEAMAPWLAEHPSWDVAVTGRGAPGYEEDLRGQLQQLGIETRVHLLGSIRDMPAFYRACEIVCVPSRAEPFGRTVIEAFAIGTPVIGTRVGGIPEIIDDTLTGRLVDYGDATGLRRILTLLVTDPAERVRLRDEALQAAAHRYTASVYTSQLRKAVNSLVQA